MKISMTSYRIKTRLLVEMGNAQRLANERKEVVFIILRDGSGLTYSTNTVEHGKVIMEIPSTHSEGEG